MSSTSTRCERPLTSFCLVHLADALKAGQKVAEDVKTAAGKKLDEAQKAGETLKKKASDGVEDL